jgi:hypothetical protein
MFTVYFTDGRPPVDGIWSRPHLAATLSGLSGDKFTTADTYRLQGMFTGPSKRCSALGVSKIIANKKVGNKLVFLNPGHFAAEIYAL